MDAITEEALTIAGKSPGVEFPELASIIHGLAEAKIKQARYEKAHPWREKLTRCTADCKARTIPKPPGHFSV